MQEARYGTQYIEEPLTGLEEGQWVSDYVKVPLIDITSGDEYVLDDMLPQLLVGDAGLYEWEYQAADIVNGTAEDFIIFKVSGYVGQE